DYFTGNEIPDQVEQADAGAVTIDVQYQEPNGLRMDQFSNGNWHTNDLGGAVTANLPSNPGEGDLFTLDNYSPHDHTGGELVWNAGKHLYTSALPVADQDLHKYRMLSFRVTQRYNSGSNPAGADQDFKVILTDEDGKTRHVNVSHYARLDYPFVRGYSNLIKSSLKTVRIPLKAFKTNGHGEKEVDLKEVVSVTFDLGVKPTGDIEVTDIEFVLDAKEA
ncbi:MAG TPA: hypothetical protein VGT01_06540, partial [Candidatus Dormibacteraeota bacterium]|nr:hypothetical protein [Candidatus Dormibacteraeota bacterium]